MQVTAAGRAMARVAGQVGQANQMEGSWCGANERLQGCIRLPKGFIAADQVQSSRVLEAGSGLPS